MTSREHRGYEALRRTFGDSAADRAADVYRDRVQPLLESLSYRFDPRCRASRQRLATLQNRHAGQRCFIIGNGPSLKGMDLRPLQTEFTFGLNRGYLLSDRIGGPTTFLVAVNRYVVEQFASEMLTTGSETFIGWRSRNWVPAGSDVSFVRRGRPFTFASDMAAEGVWEGATVTYVALQLAFHMGFDDVILIGVDHSFTSHGPANELVVSEEADPNHFDPSYFGPGVRWQLPDLTTSEIAYRLAQSAFERAGRRVTDATVGGSLEVFPKTDFERVIDEGSNHMSD